jgi:hypothetical protein
LKNDKQPMIAVPKAQDPLPERRDGSQRRQGALPEFRFAADPDSFYLEASIPFLAKRKSTLLN